MKFRFIFNFPPWSAKTDVWNFRLILAIALVMKLGPSLPPALSFDLRLLKPNDLFRKMLSNFRYTQAWMGYILHVLTILTRTWVISIIIFWWMKLDVLFFCFGLFAFFPSERRLCHCHGCVNLFEQVFVKRTWFVNAGVIAEKRGERNLKSNQKICS